MNKLQKVILSGQFRIGERLPSERELAKMLGVSRPVLHEAIVALNAQGLVHIEARRGVFVSDYRCESSMALMNTLLEYEEGDFDPELFRSLMEGRLLIERETARLAAEKRDEQTLQKLQELVEKGKNLLNSNSQELTDYDFQFHLEIALASGNRMYPMILNSLRGVHKNLAGKFYRDIFGKLQVQTVLDFHQSLLEAVAGQDPQAASQIMADLLRHGEENINRILFN